MRRVEIGVAAPENASVLRVPIATALSEAQACWRGRDVARVAGVVLWAASGDAWASNPAPADGHGVIGNIAICMVAASVLGLLVRALRQPLILAYILAGVAIGPVGLRLIVDSLDIATLAEIGLILLLFMIGLEIDVRTMLSAGRLVIIGGVLQFPICALLAYFAFRALAAAGLDLGGSYAVVYAAIAVSLSSTMIVVKLLYDNFQLDTLPGRITVGILVFQDIWAIIVLAVQPTLADPQITGIAFTFLAGGLLVGGALIVSKWVLPRVFHSIAKLPELVLVLSLGWCFCIALVAAHPRVGLSMEMGALIAGISLASLPYYLDVIAKVVTIRDFFITLYFVAVGMQIPAPDARVLALAFAVAAVAVAVRVFGIFGVLFALRSGHRAAWLPTINLAQVSEFSLVILSLGVGLGHIAAHTLTALVYVFAALAVLSTYLITYNDAIQRVLSRLATWVGLRDIGHAFQEEGQAAPKPIVLLGCHRLGSALLAQVAEAHSHLLPLIRVVDFNPEVKMKLDKMKVECVYGDVSHADTLHHAGVHHARVVVNTLPDAILQGMDDRTLLQTLRALCPNASVVLTAESGAQARAFYASGADYVIQPWALGGESLAALLDHALERPLGELRSEAMRTLEARAEVLA